MKRKCPNCGVSGESISNHGYFIRPSDKRKIRRYKCQTCVKTFSDATFQWNYRQKKRELHPVIIKTFCSCASERRTAKLLKISRTTVSRKLRLLAAQSFLRNKKYLTTRSPVLKFQFDDLETFEHTKCKPLSVTMAVETDTRKILGFRVSSMPAKGHLAKIARKKYGKRVDERALQRDQLFKSLSQIAHPACEIYSDQHPQYPHTVKKWFPTACHRTTKGRRGCVTGQGELKAGGFDPIFSLNHTFAMVRDNVKRLSRRTWCTTKDKDFLEDRLQIYMWFHNSVLTPQ